jgi:hypothetical protein
LKSRIILPAQGFANMSMFVSSLVVLAVASFIQARPLARDDPVQHLSNIEHGDMVFSLGDIPYLALTTTPSAESSGFSGIGNLPFTVVKFDQCSIRADDVDDLIKKYLEEDDVISESFLQLVYVSTSCEGGASMDGGALDYLASMGAQKVYISSRLTCKGAAVTIEGPDGLEPGPYIASIKDGVTSFSSVYRLYEDRYRTFIFGAYEDPSSNSFKPFPVNAAKYQDPLIPVPSRIYSWSDKRPFAGFRIAIKDLYDIKGLQTAGGSRAWATITPVANKTAPAIQRLVDLGAHLVGKQKTAQFASGANPWDWYDVQYPFNPRGDEWLTCSASSAGAGCSMAAYDWLDHAVGSDTGSSVRRPAAVSGTYGNRPSQGMISLENVQPLGAAQDTAGFFSRTPHAFAYFARHWYTPDLFQNTSITGLERLTVPERDVPLPRTVYYTPEYLPVRNPAADALVQDFYKNLTSLLGMTQKTLNLTSILLQKEAQGQGDTTSGDYTASPSPQIDLPGTINISTWNNATSLLNTYTQWNEVARPLIDAWGSLYDGRFPPIDPARRPGWVARTSDNVTQAEYEAALATKRTFSEWFNTEFLGQGFESTDEPETTTAEECGESALWIYDIGTGGLPSYRERELIAGNAFATYLNYTPPETLTSGVNFCSTAGCADFTVPIGQVPYFSNVTRVVEMVPVTLSLVMRRGCDFSLFGLVERMADVGMLRGVRTGRTAF